MKQIGNGSMPLRIGNMINTNIYGGPFYSKPDGFFGVKMAAEIEVPCDVDIPTIDFQVPIVSDVQAGVVQVLMAAMSGRNIYVGCMGGIGRTGLFMAALAKVQIEYRKLKHRGGRGLDPVSIVRANYIPHAVETAPQQKFIDDLDVEDIVHWLSSTQTLMGLGGVTPGKAELSIVGDTEVKIDDPVGIIEDPYTRHGIDIYKEATTPHPVDDDDVIIEHWEDEIEGIDTGDLSGLYTRVLSLEIEVKENRLEFLEECKKQLGVMDRTVDLVATNRDACKWLLQRADAAAKSAFTTGTTSVSIMAQLKRFKKWIIAD